MLINWQGPQNMHTPVKPEGLFSTSRGHDIRAKFPDGLPSWLTECLSSDLSHYLYSLWICFINLSVSTTLSWILDFLTIIPRENRLAVKPLLR